MKKFEHKQTGKIAELMDCTVAYVAGWEVPAWMILNSDDWQEVTKLPILTTEDGVDLFDGDKHWWMDASNMHIGEDPTDEDDPARGYKYFSTLEAAREYRLWHYKGLSLKDINDNCDIHEDHFKNLEELVKSRLK